MKNLILKMSDFINENKEYTEDELTNFFEERDFNVHKLDDDEGVELETWTDGGVNMIFHLNPFTIKEFKNRVDGFDIDEEIELHRQADDYKSAFTIRQSLEDFEAFEERLKEVLEELK